MDKTTLASRHLRGKLSTLAVIASIALTGCDQGVSVLPAEDIDQPPIAYTDAYWAELAQSYPAFTPEPDIGRALRPEDRITEGRWSPVIDWPQIASGASNLPDGQIMTWSSTQETNSNSGPTFTHGSIFDPATGEFAIRNNPAHDMFCSGVAMLSDGQVMAAGGGATISTTSLYDNDAWSLLQNMERPRWYPTVTTLPSGQAFASLGDQYQSYPEIWTAGQGWQLQTNMSLQSVLDDISAVNGQRHWYPALNVTPDGSLFHPGPTSQLFTVNLANTGSVTPHGSRESGDPFRLYNTTVMYDVGKMLIAGGGTPALATAMTIDVNAASPVVAPASPMNYPRSMHNSIVMPDGKVLVIGGNSSGVQFSDQGTQLVPEMWNPQTGVWQAMAPHSVPRNYHSTALLLKDGRVAAMGGGVCGGCATNHKDGEIYEPPYLFKPDGTAASRPIISGGPAQAKAGDTVTLSGTDDIVKFNMLRLVALTHHHTTDQRLVPVSFQKPATGSYQLNMPDNPNVLIPGYYWVFGLDAIGVPSIGHTIKIGVSALTEVTPVEKPVTYDYFEGSWTALPDFSLLTPVASGTLSSFSLSAAQRADNFAIRYSATLTIPDAGSYTFYTTSDDGSQLFIDGQLVVDNDGIHGAEEKQGTINLTAGDHNIVVTMFEQAGGQLLNVMWSGADFIKTDVTSSLRATDDNEPVVPTQPSQQAVRYEFYQGTWNVLPVFDSLTPVSTGELNSFSIAAAQGTENFAFRFSSSLSVPVAGEYTFYTTSDDGSQLFIDNQLIVNNDGLHGALEKQGSVNLSAGEHSIVVTMFEKNGGELLDVKWSGPGMSKGDITVSLQSAAPAAPVTPIEPETPLANNLIANSTFEEGVTGWNSCSANAVISSSDQAYSGQSSLAVQGCAFSEFQVTENERYRLDCRGQGNSASYSSITLTFSDALYNQLGTVDIALDSPAYKDYSLELLAPAGSVNGSVDFYAEGAAANFDDCTVVSDNVTPTDPVTPTEPETPVTPVNPVVPASNLLSNSTFEQDTTGWDVCAADSIIGISSQSNTGTQAMAVQGCAFTEFLPVAAQSYRLSCFAQGNSTSYSSITLSFSDAAYTRLGAIDVVLDSAAYKEYLLEFVAPSGSANAAVDFYTEGGAANFDDCVVIPN